MSRINDWMRAKGRNTSERHSWELCNLFLPASRNVNSRMETYGPLSKSPVANCKICLWSLWVWIVASLLKSILLQVYHLSFAFMVHIWFLWCFFKLTLFSVLILLAMAWFGRNLKDHLVRTYPPWQGYHTLNQAAQPTWPWALPGMEHPQFLWATWAHLPVCAYVWNCPNLSKALCTLTCWTSEGSCRPTFYLCPGASGWHSILLCQLHCSAHVIFKFTEGPLDPTFFVI